MNEKYQVKQFWRKKTVTDQGIIEIDVQCESIVHALHFYHFIPSIQIDYLIVLKNESIEGFNVVDSRDNRIVFTLSKV